MMYRSDPSVSLVLTFKATIPFQLIKQFCNYHSSGCTSLVLMQKATGAAHAFQVVRDLPYAGADAFSYREPIAVSAQSFLSQLF